ncbi:MAG: hypothetical protein ACLPN5_11530 [Roseiarcus sp.]
MENSFGTLAFMALVIVLPVLLGGCAIQRAETARSAKEQMIGLSDEKVLACMGPPADRMTVGQTEVWSYQSGNGQTVGSVFASGGNGFASGFGVTEQRFCKVNIVMSKNAVSEVNYSGPTGGLLTQGEQCAFAVQNCVQP